MKCRWSWTQLPWWNKMAIQHYLYTQYYYQCDFPSFSPTDPEVYLPMDEASGDVLLGSLNGTLANDMALVTGRIGKGLYINNLASHLDLGSHPSQCFHFPDNCTHGVTFALWIRSDRDKPYGNILCTGANKKKATGKWYGTIVCTDAFLNLVQNTNTQRICCLNINYFIKS